jgi:hypothetical protein
MYIGVNVSEKGLLGIETVVNEPLSQRPGASGVHGPECLPLRIAPDASRPAAGHIYAGWVE